MLSSHARLDEEEEETERALPKCEREALRCLGDSISLSPRLSLTLTLLVHLLAS